MKVFFTAALDGKKEYQEVFNNIIEFLKSQNIEVISKEIQTNESLVKRKLLKGLKPEEAHYKFVKKGISLSDAVIIEASVNKFQLGHEATLALLYNKPVLCVSQTKDYSIQIQHSKFYSYKYESIEELHDRISEFIKDLEKKHLPIRFNAFITPEQKTFLDWYSNKYKKSASTLVRELIDSKIGEMPEFGKEL